MIYTKHSNGKLYMSNDSKVIDILTEKEMREKVKSQSFFKRLLNPITVI